MQAPNYSLDYSQIRCSHRRDLGVKLTERRVMSLFNSFLSVLCVSLWLSALKGISNAEDTRDTQRTAEEKLKLIRHYSKSW